MKKGFGIFIGLLIPLIGSAASFDCNKASSEVEKMICRDSELSALDDSLAKAYKSARAIAGETGIATLKSEQLNWLKSRNSCTDIDCLKTSISSRIATLSPSTADINSRKESNPAATGPQSARQDKTDEKSTPTTPVWSKNTSVLPAEYTLKYRSELSTQFRNCQNIMQAQGHFLSDKAGIFEERFFAYSDNFEFAAATVGPDMELLAGKPAYNADHFISKQKIQNLKSTLNKYIEKCAILYNENSQVIKTNYQLTTDRIASYDRFAPIGTKRFPVPFELTIEELSISDENIKAALSKENAALKNKFPYYAVITCGLGEKNLNALNCFFKSELKIVRGNTGTIYKIYNMAEAGNIDNDGITINLPKEFALTAENSSKNLILGVKIFDRDGNMRFSDQAGHWDFVSVEM